MNEAQIKSIVQNVLAMLGEDKAPAALANPNVTDEIELSDLADIDLRRQYLVTSPKDRDAFMALKEKTPARVGVGHAGARYRTQTTLRFAADHARAQDAVFTDVPQAFLEQMGLQCYSTACRNRDEFLTGPDKGRRFTPDELSRIKQAIPANLPVLLYLADGLSQQAVTANAANILPVIQNGLKGYGIASNDPFFVRFGRVATMDALGGALSPEVICVLLGERPGLVTASSMSAYIAYRPSVGMPESRRTVVANIHAGGTPAVEAGAFIVDLIRVMLSKKASGLELTV